VRVTSQTASAGAGPDALSGRLPREARAPVVPSFVQEIGGMAYLVYVLIVRGLRPPYSWMPEFVSQFRFTVKVCFFPLILSSFALAFGPMGVQGSGFFELFGSFDRMGSLYELVVVRLFAPLVVGVIVAGAAGTAICADLGARVVREETAALSVLGVDPVKSLVLPRVLALMLAAVLFNIFAVVSGLLAAIVVLGQHHADLGPAFSTFFANATPLELAAATLKAGIYGFVIALVCCYKGINVSGGPEGVGRAVNQSVVVAFVAIGFIDYVFTQLLLATHPILSQVRG
jgi:phospholipid/cholesterol/gamma-HCH transport system permease protein